MIRQSPKPSPTRPAQRTSPRPPAPATQLASAGGFLGSLKIWQKLLLIVLAFSVAGVWPVATLYLNQQRQEAQARDRLIGYQYATLLFEAVQQVSQHRRHSLDVRWVGARADLAQEAADVDAALARLTDLNNSLGDRYGLAPVLQEIGQAWVNIKNRAAAAPNSEIFELHHRLIGQLQRVVERVSLSSGLLLGTEAEVFLITETAVRHLPEMRETLAQLRFLGMEVFTRGSALIFEREQIMSLLSQVRRQSETILWNITQTEVAHDRDLEAIALELERIVQQVNQLDTLLTTALQAPARLTYSPAEYGAAIARINTGITELQLKTLGLVDRQMMVAWQQVHHEQALTFVVIALALVLALGVVGTVTRSVTGPVAQLFSASTRLRKGDLGVQVAVQSSDELGSLARTFNETTLQLKAKAEADAEQLRQSKLLQENISTFLNVVMDIAQGDLSKRGRVTEDVLGNVVDAVNLTVEEIAYLLKQVQAATEMVNQGALQMAQSSASIQEKADSQAELSARARIEALDATDNIRNVASQVAQNTSLVLQAREAAEQGQGAVQNTLSGMQNIRREVQSISKNIKGLSDRSLEISEVVDAIGRIAKQTNLLALNAAIEAAGAGDAGARFAVVADQVRKLAEDSARAAQRVGVLVKGIQTEIQGVVVAVEGGTREVEQGYQIAAEAGSRLEQIAALAQQSADEARYVAQATQENVSRVEEVTNAVQEIYDTALETDQESRKGRQTAEDLRALAQQLQESLTRFRLPA
jgi:twitching motility protein PilJ